MNAADKKFLREMVEHHKMAIKMSKMVIMDGDDRDVKSMAEEIIKAQSKEIENMERMLTNKEDEVDRFIKALTKINGLFDK